MTGSDHGHVEPDDLGDDGHHVPAELSELYEILEWERALAEEGS